MKDSDTFRENAGIWRRPPQMKPGPSDISAWRMRGRLWPRNRTGSMEKPLPASQNNPLGIGSEHAAAGIYCFKELVCFAQSASSISGSLSPKEENRHDKNPGSYRRTGKASC